MLIEGDLKTPHATQVSKTITKLLYSKLLCQTASPLGVKLWQVNQLQDQRNRRNETNVHCAVPKTHL